MASIIMKRGTTSEISNTPISDGQILFETDTKNIYIDEGSNRIEYRATTIDIDSKLSTTSKNPVQNKVITTNINDINTKLNSIDSKLSTTSKNPVQNKVVTTNINDINTKLNSIDSKFGVGEGKFPASSKDNVSCSVPSDFNSSNCCQIGFVAKNSDGYWFNITDDIAISYYPGRVRYTATNTAYNNQAFKVIYYKYA